ncbi:hypothetical protein BDY24DRAFT_385430 [Mrakia frigida]|uniref:transcription factor TFIIE subunit TFA2 n=1 Tax=Mrakia frigida TaxID=29902 RepID=UPI003FCC26A2
MASSSSSLPVKHELQDGGLSADRKKKQKIAVVYSQPTDTGRGNHSNTKLAYAVQALRERKGNPARAEDLSMEIGWEELQYDQAAQDLLKEHEKIKFDERTKLFSYKADHQISTPASLLATIKLHKDKAGGVSVKSLRESWAGSQQALEELIKEGDVLPMKIGKEGKYRQVFWNEVGLERGGKQVDQEFRDAWHALRVPADIERALDESGIRASATEDSDRAVTGPKKKGKKAGVRRVKLTNLHMAGLGVDLSKDRVGSAGTDKKKK